MNSLYSSRISSGPGVPLRLLADGNFSININNKNRNLNSDLILNPSGLRLAATKFSVFSPNKKLLFSTSSAGTVIGSEKLVLTGLGGVSVKGSLATKAVRSPAGHSLSLESTTSSLSLLAPAGVSVSSLSGAVQIAALRDIKMRARGHNSQFKIDAGIIRLPRLLEVKSVHNKHHQYLRNTSHPGGGHENKQGDLLAVYQLCICRSGRLFLSPALSHCVADSHVCRQDS